MAKEVCSPLRGVKKPQGAGLGTFWWALIEELQTWKRIQIAKDDGKQEAQTEGSVSKADSSRQ